MQNWKYVKVFDGLPPCRPSLGDLADLLRVLSAFRAGEVSLPAGYTYFGQFIDHDLSFLLENGAFPDPGTLAEPVDVCTLTLARKPALDLDSVYGGGFSDSVIPFDKVNGKFILGDAAFGRNRDFSRDANFQPRIGDPRNDENLLVAQIQILFMSLHNKIVQDLVDRGWRDPDCLFERARAEVTKIYQHLVLHDFLKTLVPGPVYRDVVVNGDGWLTSPSKRAPTLAIEVSDAALRLHPLVRATYRLNSARLAKLEEIVDVAGNARRNGGVAPPLLKMEDEIDWRRFFKFDHYPRDTAPIRPQHAQRLCVALNDRLKELDVGHGRRVNMLYLNVSRGIARGLCSGQNAVRELTRRFPKLAATLNLRPLATDDVMLGQLSKGNSIRECTPLWVYVMREADVATGARLGALGGWLLADTLRTAALSADVGLRDPTSPRPYELYPPFVNAAGGRDAITVEDVISYTYDRP